MSQPSGIAPERELEWIKLPKDTYDEMVVRLRDLKVENQRLDRDNKALTSIDPELFFKFLGDKCYRSHDDYNGETIFRISDDALHDKFHGGA